MKKDESSELECPFCGSSIDSKERYCPECGTDLSDAGEEEEYNY